MIKELLAGLACIGYTAGVADAPETKGRVIVFGDDLGDSGNLQKLTNDSTIGYHEGRLTNGPTFAEYMATSMDLTFKSYAYANATIDNEWIPSKVDTFSVPALNDQIIEFTETERDWIRRKNGIHKSIAVVSAGTTDVIKKNSHLLQTTKDRDFAQKLVDNVFLQVRALGKLGFEGIAITNLPALYIMPRWRLLASVDVLHDFVAQANLLFRESLIENEQSITGTKLWLLDLESFLLVTANTTFSKTIGAKNTTSPCISNLGSCTDPADFVFYDSFHMDVRLSHMLGLAAANMARGGDIQYTSSYFGKLAKDYEIGVLYHTTATIVAIDPTYTGQEQATNTPADPLLTSVQNTAANCSLTAMCTAVSVAQAFAATNTVHSNALGVKVPAWSFIAVLAAALSL
ncbi:hypothetical protein LPJ58_003715 [Coemansia sp. RSA 1591]|nr:hypothetical protein LPJ58_003715 [Coemansia sp. RSA 1591]KAJ1759715.1 hypothetical protein LPJ69_003670 [Coemansia sp. RSA 1752]